MLNLREAKETDLQDILALENRPEYTNFLLKWDPAIHRDNLKDPNMRYLVLDNENGGLASYAILNGVHSANRSVEFVRLVVANPNKGLGKEMMKSVTLYAFDRLNAHKLWFDVFSDNERALHVYHTLNYHQDGVLRDAVYRDGKWHSLILMSMLESEKGLLFTPTPVARTYKAQPKTQRDPS